KQPPGVRLARRSERLGDKMIDRAFPGSALCATAALTLGALFGSAPARADGNLQNVNHIIIVMMENPSFDNYLAVLPYVPGTPYHNAKGNGISRRRRSRRPHLRGRAELPATQERRVEMQKCEQEQHQGAGQGLP